MQEIEAEKWDTETKSLIMENPPPEILHKFSDAYIEKQRAKYAAEVDAYIYGGGFLERSLGIVFRFWSNVFRSMFRQ